MYIGMVKLLQVEVMFRYLDKIVENCPPRSILQSCDGFGDYVLMRELPTSSSFFLSLLTEMKINY